MTNQVKVIDTQETTLDIGPLYGIKVGLTHMPSKCKQCNSRRRREYITPMGRHEEEACICSYQRKTYSVEDIRIIEAEVSYPQAHSTVGSKGSSSFNHQKRLVVTNHEVGTNHKVSGRNPYGPRVWKGSVINPTGVTLDMILDTPSDFVFSDKKLLNEAVKVLRQREQDRVQQEIKRNVAVDLPKSVLDVEVSAEDQSTIRSLYESISGGQRQSGESPDEFRARSIAGLNKLIESIGDDYFNVPIAAEHLGSRIRTVAIVTPAWQYEEV